MTVLLRDYPSLTDGVVQLSLRNTYAGGDSYGRVRLVPSYDFDIRLTGKPVNIGRMSLRIGNTRHIRMYAGNIGYVIHEAYRGKGYGARALYLARRVARDHGMRTLWIACQPDNEASRNILESIGCDMVGIVTIPKYMNAYKTGYRQTCRYRWDLLKRPEKGAPA